MSGSAPARAHANPFPDRSTADTADASRLQAANLGNADQASRYLVPGPDVTTTSAQSAPAKSFQLSDLKAPTYVMVALLATFVVIAPYFMHANWVTLGPIWARI